MKKIIKNITISVNLDLTGRTNHRQKVMRIISWTDGRIYNLECTPLGDECIETLDPQTGNIFVFISSVGV